MVPQTWNGASQAEGEGGTLHLWRGVGTRETNPSPITISAGSWSQKGDCWFRIRIRKRKSAPVFIYLLQSVMFLICSGSLSKLRKTSCADFFGPSYYIPAYPIYKIFILCQWKNGVEGEVKHLKIMKRKEKIYTILRYVPGSSSQSSFVSFLL